MNRTPPVEVRKILRNEIGFGCPIPDCGKPYLEWHHFSPPWREKEHHNPEGMIALCAEHHNKADSGAYTKEQLQKFKEEAIAHNQEVKGRFDWLRNDLLVVVGGNFYYETFVIFEYKQKPRIWFRRDEEGYLLLNIEMFSTSNEERTFIEDNFWIKRGQPADLESPPSGKLLKVDYSNGDFLRVEFFELTSFEDIQKRYPNSPSELITINLPITAVEVHYKIGGTDIEFAPASTRIGNIFMKNSFFAKCRVAISMD